MKASLKQTAGFLIILRYFCGTHCRREFVQVSPHSPLIWVLYIHTIITCSLGSSLLGLLGKGSCLLTPSAGSVQFSSVIQPCSILCNPVDSNAPGFSVRQQLPELAQTHVHQVIDAFQPSHSLKSPSLPTFNVSQHQGLS